MSSLLGGNMGNQFDPRVYLQNLYTALENQYQNDPEWTRWNEDRLYFIRELNDNISPHDEPDVCFLTTLCSIARNDQSQSRLASTVMPIFLNDYEGDLRNIQTDEDCQNLGLYPKLVPYKWLTSLASYLKEQNMSFAEFLQNMDGLSGLEIRDELKQVTKAKSTFVKIIIILTGINIVFLWINLLV